MEFLSKFNFSKSPTSVPLTSSPASNIAPVKPPIKEEVDVDWTFFLTPGSTKLPVQENSDSSKCSLLTDPRFLEYKSQVETKIRLTDEKIGLLGEKLRLLEEKFSLSIQHNEKLQEQIEILGGRLTKEVIKNEILNLRDLKTLRENDSPKPTESQEKINNGKHYPDEPEKSDPYFDLDPRIKGKIKHLDDGNLRVFPYGEDNVLLHGKTACLILKDKYIKPLRVFKYNPNCSFGPGWIGKLKDLELLEKQVNSYNITSAIKIKI